MNTQTDNPIAQELREVVARAEDLMRSIGDAEDVTVVQLRERAARTMKDAKSRLSEASATARVSFGEFTQSTEDYVRENPWTAVGASAAIGLVCGALLARR